MSEWVLHCAVNQRHIRRSQPTREAALKDACSQLLEGHSVNRIVGPNETISAERVRIGAQSIDPRPRRNLQIKHSNESGTLVSDSTSQWHPKNDGYSKSKSVTAVTSFEAGSVAPYSYGRYGNTPSPLGFL
jgi:hypothetical protein